MTGTKTLKGAMLALTCALLLACGMSLPAYAAATAATVDLSAKGSISAILEASDDTHPTNGEMSLYQVADLELVNGNMTYTYTSAFEGCEASLDDVTVASLASELDTYVKEHEIAATSTSEISSEGTVSFSDLSVGLYLVAQTTQSTGYSLIDAFLVSIPLDVDDTWVYDVDASPKIEPATPDSSGDDNPGDDNPGDDNPGDDNPGSSTPGSSTPGGTTSGGTTSGGSGGNTGTTTPGSSGGSGTTGNSGTPSTGTGSGSGSGSNTPSNTAAASTLPQTGQLNWPIPVLIVAGVACVIAGIAIARTSSRKKA